MNIFRAVFFKIHLLSLKVPHCFGFAEHHAKPTVKWLLRIRVEVSRAIATLFQRTALKTFNFLSVHVLPLRSPVC